MTKKLLNAVCLAMLGAVAVPVAAQTTTAQTPPAAATASKDMPEGGVPTFVRPETPEQRRARLGTPEDPGMNPDSKKIFWRFGRAYHIERVPRQWAAYDAPDPNYVRPIALVNVVKEIYQHNEKYVWIWVEEPEDPATVAAQAAEQANDLYLSTQGTRRFTEPEVQFFQKVRSEFTELAPPTSNVTIRFEEASKGLPNRGSWRNSLAVADMNNDGKLDLIAPPERGSDIDPAIFLGDGQGNWKYWREVKWPRALAYGSVSAADFNRDGNMDLAFGVHLQGIFVFLGDGKGTFTNVNEGLPRDFPTRRVVLDDVDADGYTDIISISEGPTAMQFDMAETHARLRVYYNRKNGTVWEGVNAVDPTRRLAGDYLAVGRFNNDKYPDFAGSSIYFNSTDTLFLSKSAREWVPVDAKNGEVVPQASYYLAAVAGKFSSPKRDDAVVSFVRTWPSDLNPKLVPFPPSMTIGGIDRVAFDNNGQPKRTSIVRWTGNDGVWGLGSGDFNGDGHEDLVYSRMQPREAVLLLNDGKGNFTRARAEGLELAPKANYDIRVADVNDDHRPDVIVMYESSGTTAFAERTGAIQVFLNRGTVAAPAAQAAK